MRKRYMAIYLYGFLFSVLLFVVLYFTARFYFIDFYYLAFAPEEKDFSEGEYWEKVFFEDRNYFREIESFYNSIEDWNFDSIGISAEKLGKEVIYWMSDEYLYESFLIQSEYPLNKFLQFSLKRQNYPKDGCSITILGNYKKTHIKQPIRILGDYQKDYIICKKNDVFYQRNYNMFSNSQIIVIELYSNDTKGISTEFIYSPIEPLYFNESESETYDLKLVDEGWYFLKRCSNQIPVILY